MSEEYFKQREQHAPPHSEVDRDMEHRRTWKMVSVVGARWLMKRELQGVRHFNSEDVLWGLSWKGFGDRKNQRWCADEHSSYEKLLPLQTRRILSFVFIVSLSLPYQVSHKILTLQPRRARTLNPCGARGKWDEEDDVVLQNLVPKELRRARKISQPGEGPLGEDEQGKGGRSLPLSLPLVAAFGGNWGRLQA